MNILTQEPPREDEAEYAAFVEKFKPKRTTDDCFTPENIYDVVADWVAKEYGVDRQNFVRPFWPDGDFEEEAQDYGPETIVVDNPPFSIVSQVAKFYQARGIRFFVFAPALTLFSACLKDGVNAVAAHANITYGNGANVRTSFLTNMGGGKNQVGP